jgi:hypothetical protein
VTTNGALEYLDDFPGVDWSDGDAAAEASERLLEQLQGDRAGLEKLVRRVGTNAELLDMCESDEFRFKIVLYDAPDRGFRVRLHAWRSDFADTPHQHRFAYAARLLTGSYQHVIYAAGQELAIPGIERYYDQHLPLDHELVAGRIDPGLFKRILSFTAVAGRSYFQGSEVDLSSTIISENTVSLFVRGPAVRDCSFQWHRDGQTIVWRAGAAHAPAEHQASVRTDRQTFDEIVDTLASLGIFESDKNGLP